MKLIYLYTKLIGTIIIIYFFLCPNHTHSNLIVTNIIVTHFSFIFIIKFLLQKMQMDNIPVAHLQNAFYYKILFAVIIESFSSFSSKQSTSNHFS